MVATQPFVGAEAGVVVTGIVGIDLLDALLAGLPVVPHIVHAPVRTAPDDDVVNHRVWPIGHVGDIVGELAIVVQAALKAQFFVEIVTNGSIEITGVQLRVRHDALLVGISTRDADVVVLVASAHGEVRRLQDAGAQEFFEVVLAPCRPRRRFDIAREVGRGVLRRVFLGVTSPSYCGMSCPSNFGPQTS